MQLKLNPPTPGVWPWLGKVLVLAAAYFVTGKLGMLLAVPPGYATCIWPPSGIALVGLLLMGSRHWPGVVLGSFCVNVGLGFDASSTAAMSSASGGSGTYSFAPALIAATAARLSVSTPQATTGR